MMRLNTMLENSLLLFMLLLVRVNSRPANCDSLMELCQGSTSTNYFGFPRHASNVGILVPQEFQSVTSGPFEA